MTLGCRKFDFGSLARITERTYLYKTLKALMLTSADPQKVQENKQ